MPVSLTEPGPEDQEHRAGQHAARAYGSQRRGCAMRRVIPCAPGRSASKMPSRSSRYCARADVARVRDVDVDDPLDPRRPRAHHDHAVGELHGFVDVMRHEDDRLPFRLPDPQQLAAHDQPGDGIERAERLVEEEHVGIDRERARHFHALLHAARKLLRIRVLEALEPDQLDVVRDAPLPLRRGEA